MSMCGNVYEEIRTMIPIGGEGVLGHNSWGRLFELQNAAMWLPALLLTIIMIMI
jgi:hypothetical protein